MSENNHAASAMRHLAPAHHGDLLAAALFERRVSLWNISTGQCLSEFDTILDFGGTRLALSEANKTCLAGCYSGHGLACYSMLEGELLWQRKDLQEIQQVTINADETEAYCSVDSGPCRVVELSTGETVDQIQGVRRLWLDRENPRQLRQSSDLEVVDQDGTHAFFIEQRNRKSVLDAVFSQRHLAVSEAGGDVRIFELSSGREVATHRQPRNHHVLALGFSNDLSVFYGVQWNYHKGGAKRLHRFQIEAEEFELVREFDECSEIAFCKQGRVLVTTDGTVIDCESGQTLISLHFPGIEITED